MGIRIKKALKAYGDKVTLDIEDLYLEKGVYAVLGLNGSGKSTLLNGLAGIVPFTASDIIYEDQGLLNKAIMLQQVYMFQGTVRDNLLLPLKIAKIPVKLKEDRLRAYMEKLDIMKYENKRARNLSGGEKAKVAFLRTIIKDPALILLDEPTSNIDIKASMTIRDCIADLRGEGRTVLFSTHNFVEASKIATHILFLDQGKVIAHGPKEDVLKSSIPLIEELMNIF